MTSNANGWDDSIDPMASAFRNPKFNRYDDGPGAELDDDLQPGAIASAPKMERHVDIYIGNMSVDLTEQGVRNMCCKYGNILYIKRSVNTRWAIVQYDSLSAAENAIQGIATLGYNAKFAENKKNPERRQESNFDHAPPHRPNEKIIDWNRRQIVAPFGSPFRLEAKPLPPHLTESDYDQSPNLRRIDPHMDFSHSDSTYLNDRPSVHNGTHVYKEADDVMENIKDRALKSGGYHGKNVYTYPSASSQLNPAEIYQFGFCNKCQLKTYLACSRCAEFYCSVSCQRQDWLEHRKVCFPMPDLVPSLVQPEGIVPKAAKKLANHSTPDMSLKPASQTNGKFSNNVAPVKEMSNIKLENPRRSAKASSPKDRDNYKKASPKPNKTPLDAQVVTIVKEPLTPALVAPPAKNANVVITHVYNHRCVFIRSAEPLENLNFLQLTNDCAGYAKISEPLSVLPAKLDIVLAKYEDSYYRALVLKVINNDHIEVAFFDFGNPGKVKLSELKHLSDELQGRQRYNFRVTLDGVDAKLTNDDVLKYLNGLAEDLKVLKLVYDDTKDLKDVPVRLIDTDTGEIVNDCVNDLNRVNVVPITAPPISLAALEKVDISGDDVKLVVLNNKHLCMNQFSCVRQEDLHELVTNSQRFQEYCQQVNDTYTPRQYELCLARSEDDTWNRGLCVELAGDGHPLILLIDDGSMQPIHIDNIRKIPKEFTHRCVTVDCVIDGLEDTISDEYVERLQKYLCVGDTITAKHVKRIDTKSESGKDEFMIQVPDILSDLAI